MSNIRMTSIGIMCLWRLGGCGGTVPVPPEPANAQLPRNAAIYAETVGAGDTIVVGRCVSSEAYATTPRGDWVDHWHLVRVEVIAVEKGQWDKRIGQDARAGFRRRPAPIGLTFIVVDSWPTPESGILLGIAPWPYSPGMVYAFSLDTSTTPALVVGQERRSLVDCRKRPAPVSYPSDQEAARELGLRIHSAAMAFLADAKGSQEKHTVEIIEQTDSSYIVLARTGGDAKVLAVGRNDFGVTPVWPDVQK